LSQYSQYRVAVRAHPAFSRRDAMERGEEQAQADRTTKIPEPRHDAYPTKYEHRLRNRERDLAPRRASKTHTTTESTKKSFRAGIARFDRTMRSIRTGSWMHEKNNATFWSGPPFSSPRTRALSAIVIIALKQDLNLHRARKNGARDIMSKLSHEMRITTSLWLAGCCTRQIIETIYEGEPNTIHTLRANRDRWTSSSRRFILCVSFISLSCFSMSLRRRFKYANLHRYHLHNGCLF